MKVRKFSIKARECKSLVKELSNKINAIIAFMEMVENLEIELRELTTKCEVQKKMLDAWNPEIKKIEKLLGNPCPHSNWVKTNKAEVCESEGWVRINFGSTTQYFKLNKIEVNYGECEDEKN